MSQGQVIAEMSSTGNSNKPHLHFEVHPNGKILSGAVNPLPFLPPLVGGQITRSRPVAFTSRKPIATTTEWLVVSRPHQGNFYH